MPTKTNKAALRQELLDVEDQYLEAVERNDGEAAANLTAPESLVVGEQGPLCIDSSVIRQIVDRHDGSSRFAIDKSSAKVVRVSDDVAIISYKLRTTLSDGEATDAYDTDVWVRRAGRWACALHAETPAA